MEQYLKFVKDNHLEGQMDQLQTDLQTIRGPWQ